MSIRSGLPESDPPTNQEYNEEYEEYGLEEVEEIDSEVVTPNDANLEPSGGELQEGEEPAPESSEPEPEPEPEPKKRYVGIQIMPMGGDMMAEFRNRLKKRGGNEGPSRRQQPMGGQKPPSTRGPGQMINSNSVNQNPSQRRSRGPPPGGRRRGGKRGGKRLPSKPRGVVPPPLPKKGSVVKKRMTPGDDMKNKPVKEIPRRVSPNDAPRRRLPDRNNMNMGRGGGNWKRAVDGSTQQGRRKNSRGTQPGGQRGRVPLRNVRAHNFLQGMKKKPQQQQQSNGPVVGIQRNQNQEMVRKVDQRQKEVEKNVLREKAKNHPQHASFAKEIKKKLHENNPKYANVPNPFNEIQQNENNRNVSNSSKKKDSVDYSSDPRIVKILNGLEMTNKKIKEKEKEKRSIIKKMKKLKENKKKVDEDLNNFLGIAEKLNKKLEESKKKFEERKLKEKKEELAKQEQQEIVQETPMEEENKPEEVKRVSPKKSRFAGIPIIMPKPIEKKVEPVEQVEEEEYKEEVVENTKAKEKIEENVISVETKKNPQKQSKNKTVEEVPQEGQEIYYDEDGNQITLGDNDIIIEGEEVEEGVYYDEDGNIINLEDENFEIIE